ncbi:MAG: sugar transferase [Acidobacteria bacterium]|nr:sugar transferase [Acidobacteriota bacterium]
MIRLFRVFIPSSIVGLVTSETLLVLAVYLGAINWQMEELSFYLLYEDGILRLAVVTATVILGLYFSDCYVRVRMRSKTVFLQQLCLVIGIAFLLQSVLSYGNLNARMPRQSMLLGSTLCLVLMPAWRTVYSKVSLQILGAEKLLFVGTHPLQATIASHLAEHPEFAMKPVGFVIENGASPDLLEGQTVLGVMTELPQLVRKLEADRIVVGLAETEAMQAVQEIIQVQRSGYRTESASRMYETVFGRVAISQLRPLALVFREGFMPLPLMLTAQAIYSWGIAFLTLVLVWPVMLLTAIAVRLSSPGPILFRQTRTGRNSSLFTLYKFRSMYSDAEDRTGAVWAKENDPRITPLGRFLRRFRLDELPQLFNVLKSEMSIVGPRPERPEFVKMLCEQVPFYSQRLSVRPGITGWAQINYRYGNTVEDTVVKLEYDLYYIRNLSPQLDFFIMFHTLKIVLLSRGAY